MKKSKEDEFYQKERGITLIALLVTVILLSIITAVTVGNGLQSANNAELQSFFAELQVIQKRVDIIYEEAKLGNNHYITYTEEGIFESKNGDEAFGQEVSIQTLETMEQTRKTKVLYLMTTYEEEEAILNLEKNIYYYYTPEELRELGMDHIEQDVLICWDIRDVVSVDGFTAEQKTYYRDPSAYKPEYEEEWKKIVLTEDNIKQTGSAVKTIEVVELKTEEGETVSDFEVKYKSEEETVWKKAKDHRFQTAIPGKYQLQVSGDQIETQEIEIQLKPEFLVTTEQTENSKWKYTITQVFGEYTYTNIMYQYRRANGTDSWTAVTGNTFEVTEQAEYEIQVIDKNQQSNVVIEDAIVLYSSE